MLDRDEAGFQAANDETSIFIQKAIDEFEKKFNIFYSAMKANLLISSSL